MATLEELEQRIELLRKELGRTLDLVTVLTDYILGVGKEGTQTETPRGDYIV